MASPTGYEPLLLVKDAATLVVEAAGIEPFSPVNPNSMMANDFGFYSVEILELP
jgi:hypothetical protein